MIGLKNRFLALAALVSSALVTAGCDVQGQQPKVTAKPKAVAAQPVAARKATPARRVAAPAAVSGY